MKRLLILALIMIATASYAAIYVNEGKSDNNTEYTDTPTTGSAQVEVSPLNTVTSSPEAALPAAATSSAPANTAAAGAVSTSSAVPGSAAAVSTATTYKTFAITSPADGATLQNQPVIPVEMQIEPTMLAGDKIQLFLDGKAAGVPTATIYQELGLVERGVHTLYGEIINASQQTIKRSNTVTINVHRNSIITNPGNK